MSKPNVIVLAVLILASSVSKDALSNSSNSFIDTLLICKNNINKLDILPTILSQTGWTEVPQDINPPVFQHLFKKGTYEIGFSHNVSQDQCVVRQFNLTKLPNYKPEDIVASFPFSSKNKIAFCRDYNLPYPSKIIEWEYGDGNYIRYLIHFNGKEKLFNLGVGIMHSYSGKYFSLCKMADL